jgi:hypothetical protein
MCLSTTTLDLWRRRDHRTLASSPALALFGRPAREMESKSPADGRYRTLLEVSGAIASQPNLKAVLQSLRRLLSSVVAFDSLSLCLLSDNGNSVRLIAFDRGSEAYQVEIGY